LFFPLGAGAGSTAATADKAGDKDGNAATKSGGAAGAGGAPADEKPADSKPAAAKPAEKSKDASAPASAAAKPAAPEGSAAASAESKPATLGGPLSKDALAPAPPPASLPVFGGLGAAAVLMGCAFWFILKGGQHVTR